MLLALDIETLPTTDPEVIEELRKSISAPANYSKPETIQKWMEENAANALADKIAKTSFDGMYGSIACICYAFDDGEIHSVDCRDGEKKMLEDFYSHVFDQTTTAHHSGFSSYRVVMVGHNVAAFDLPFIKHRSIINQVTPIDCFIKAFAAKPWSEEIADTMLMWSSDPHKRGSMDRICRALGIPGKGDFDGSMVATTWPVDPEKVIAYCKDDVERTRQMYKRLTFDFGGNQSDLLAA